MAQGRAINSVRQLSKYEKQWRIKTNENKFTILRLGARTTEDIHANTNIYTIQSKGKTLGLHVTKTGYTEHITQRKQYANRMLSKLYRFYNMPTNIKLHLIKTLILPILDYPPIPTHNLSKTQISKLQTTQNKALRYATNQRHPYTLNTEDIHNITQTLPINIRLHQKARDI